MNDTPPSPSGGRSGFRNVAVIGSGLMGRGIGIEYALGGATVTLLASTPASSERALELARDELSQLAQAGATSAEAAHSAANRLKAGSELESACVDADLVVESIPEVLEKKQELFERLGAATRSDAVLATNTSSLAIDRIAERTRNPGRVLGTHYWNPPHLMPLVEIVLGQQTDPAAVERVELELKRLGKHTVRVRKEVPGFIWNRLQMALLREALWLVDNGVATPEDVDLSVRLGLGRRFSGIGLFEAVDMGGLGTWHNVAGRLFGQLSTATAPGPFLAELANSGRLGLQSGAGVYDWPPERAANAKARRDAHLIEWLGRDRADASTSDSE